MSRLIEHLCERVRIGEAEAFLGAHEVVREFRLKSKDGGGIEPWASWILAEPPSSDDVAKLKPALLDALVNGNDMSVAGAAAALSEYHDAQLAPILREQLHRQLRGLSRTYGAVWNLIHALERSGESALPPASSHSATEIEIAVSAARDYLRKHGIVVPW